MHEPSALQLSHSDLGNLFFLTLSPQLKKMSFNYCSGMKSVPPKFTSTHNFRMGPFWETGSLQV